MVRGSVRGEHRTGGALFWGQGQCICRRLGEEEEEGRKEEEREREKQRGGVVRESRVDEGTAGVVAVADSCRLPESTTKTSRLLRQPSLGSVLD